MQNVSTMSSSLLSLPNSLTKRAHGLDSLVHPKETESKRSYVDASVSDFAPRILLHLQSYVTLQTRDSLLV